MPGDDKVYATEKIMKREEASLARRRDVLIFDDQGIKRESKRRCMEFSTPTPEEEGTDKAGGTHRGEQNLQQIGGESKKE